MNLNYHKYIDGLIPAIVQDVSSSAVLMLGFMNQEAVAATIQTGRVTFYSRSNQRLWTKGESSGNFLEFVSMRPDCDKDTLLIKALPHGPTCHTGTETCFGDVVVGARDAMRRLEAVIDRRRDQDADSSYVASLFRGGINKIAQKVGEEAVELIIEAKDEDRQKLVEEAADVLFHYLVLLRAKDVSITDVLDELERRSR